MNALHTSDLYIRYIKPLIFELCNEKSISPLFEIGLNYSIDGQSALSVKASLVINING